MGNVSENSSPFVNNQTTQSTQEKNLGRWNKVSNEHEKKQQQQINNIPPKGKRFIKHK
jgi:hypothetical protein